MPSDTLNSVAPFPYDPTVPQTGLKPPDEPPESVGGVVVLPDPPPPPSPVIVQRSPYSEYAISKVIRTKSGLSVNVVMGPPGTPADVIRYAAPSGSVIVRWISRRRGAPPVIPSHDLGCANEVYLDGWVTGAVPGNLIDGTPCWQVEGCYFYALRVPYGEGDIITLGRFPYTNGAPDKSQAADKNQIVPAMYSKDLLGPDTPPAGAPTDVINY